MTENVTPILFYLCAAGLLLVLEVALWKGFSGRRERDSGSLSVGMNRLVYSDQIEALQADLNAGRISQKQHDRELEEIEQRVLEENAPAKSLREEPAWARRFGNLFFVLLPFLAVVLYTAFANPSLKTYQGSPEHPASVSHAMLENYLKESPRDVRAWIYLSNYQAGQRRYREALSAMNKAFELSPKGAAMEPGHILQRSALMMETGDPILRQTVISEVDRTLKIDPQNRKALEFGGMAAYSMGDYKNAVRYWSELLELLPPDSLQSAKLLDALSEAKNREMMSFGGM